jgi:hypothetical protein
MPGSLHPFVTPVWSYTEDLFRFSYCSGSLFYSFLAVAEN